MVLEDGYGGRLPSNLATVANQESSLRQPTRFGGPLPLANLGYRTNTSSNDQVHASASPSGQKCKVSNGYRPHTIQQGSLDAEEPGSQVENNHNGPNEDRRDKILKPSAAQLHELTSSPKFLPLESPGNGGVDSSRLGSDPLFGNWEKFPSLEDEIGQESATGTKPFHSRKRSESTQACASTHNGMYTPLSVKGESHSLRPRVPLRTMSTPPLGKITSANVAGMSDSEKTPSNTLRPTLNPLNLGAVDEDLKSNQAGISARSPMPPSMPMPPLSIPTYLQLELSAHRPSPLYIYHSKTSDLPYESSRVKIERLENFLLLPPQLEQVLWFGTLACLDSWLYSFTILPLRFLKALYLLLRSWYWNIIAEATLIANFIYRGIGRLWHRRRESAGRPTKTSTRIINSLDTRRLSSNESTTQTPRFKFPAENPSNDHTYPDLNSRRRVFNRLRHRRSKSLPSALLPDHKVDILKGLLILNSCYVLMYFDASRMYHSIRGQAAIKLYVIYNVLEVCDRLFSALGQDVLECLFSKETLERKPNGRSKVTRPFWLFMLALVYSVIHATALFYQVITLNVAVNSYSNALLTLLMSNQFVEIKSTVFKKFEKENLFQLTCADVVERFQLWLMLIIIASRNIVETGGLSLGLGNSPTCPSGSESTFRSPVQAGILPKSFTLFPAWVGQVAGPFLLVLGSEMLVDWLKHAYITKFNNTKPAIYGRFLDVLAKDYYSNAFADQNLTRRLGLPVIPLSCLFIRASMQTYHMFLATYMPPPIPSTATSLSVESTSISSPATTAALQHIDHVFRRALGRSTFGAGAPTLASESGVWDVDDAIAFITMLVFFLVIFLVLLALKLVLGMCLLSFSRRRYKSMKEREHLSTYAEGKRVGGWGVTEVDEDKRGWIYRDDEEGLRKLRQKEKDGRDREQDGGKDYSGVSRYSMVAKRIW